MTVLVAFLGGLLVASFLATFVIYQLAKAVGLPRW